MTTKSFLLSSLVCFFWALSIASFAQNLVPNHSFEEYDSCPSRFGNIEQTKYWRGHNASPDFFHTCATNSKVGVPKNFFGTQSACTGKGYVGLVTYHQNAEREFIGVKLLTSLQKGVTYNISFRASLAEDYSLFASNNLGAAFVKVSEQQDLNKVTYQGAPQFNLETIIAESRHWYVIKGSFVAQDNYNYLLIGNFYKGDATKTKRIGIEQTAAAYYFIDDVYVGKAFDLQVQHINILENIYFDFDKDILKEESFLVLDELVTILEKNPTMKIQINGHTDAVGTDAKNLDLSDRRAKAVVHYLIHYGKIAPQRLQAKGYGETVPLTSNDTEAGRARNRRVEFLVIEK